MQAEIAKRNKGESRYSGVSIFSTKIQCAECGGWYGAKVGHSTDKYRRVVYQCNNKFRHQTGCYAPHLTEYEIEAYFVKAVSTLITEKDEIIQNLEMVCQMLCDNTELENKLEELQKEINVTVKLIQNIVAENARVAQDQEEYSKRYNSLVKHYERLKKEYETTCMAISENEARHEELRRFLKILQSQECVLAEFDTSLWSSLMDKMVVKGKDNVTVIFNDETKIKV